MNFGNPPFFPATTQLVCINGSHEELEYNRAADAVLLSDPGAFLAALENLGVSWQDWYALQQQHRAAWVDEWFAHMDAEAAEDEQLGRKMHPLQLSLDVQDVMGGDDSSSLMAATRISGQRLPST